MDMKADKELVDVMRDDKVSKADFLNNIPNYLSQQNIKTSIKDMCELMNEDVRR